MSLLKLTSSEEYSYKKTEVFGNNHSDLKHMVHFLTLGICQNKLCHPSMRKSWIYDRHSVIHFTSATVSI